MAAASSSGGSSGAVRAGKAFVELFATDKGVTAVLDRLEKRFQKFGAQLGKIGALAAAGAATFTAPFALMAKHAIDAGSAIADVASRLGATTDEIQTLTYAASLSGSGLADIEKAMSKLRTGIAEGSMFGNLDLATLQGKSLTDQLKAVADVIANIQGKDKQLAAASAIFGEKQGRKMLTFLRDGAAGIDRMGARARRIGILNGGQVDSLDRAGDAIGEIQMLIENLSANVVLAVLGDPAEIEAAADRLIDFGAGVRKFIEDNSEAIRMAAMFVGGVLAIGTAVAAAGAAIMGIGAIIGSFAAVLSAVAFFISPTGLIILGLASLTAYLAIAASETETFNSILATFTTTWQGIKDAVAGGDLALAFEIAWTGVKAVTEKVIRALQIAWIEFKYFFIKLWDEIVAAVRIALSSVLENVPDVLLIANPAILLLKQNLGNMGQEVDDANAGDRARNAEKQAEIDAAMSAGASEEKLRELTAQAAAMAAAATAPAAAAAAGGRIMQRFGNTDFAKGVFGFQGNLAASLGVANEAQKTNNLLDKIAQSTESMDKALSSGVPLVVGA